MEVISGTTVPTYPNRASAPRMIPAGMAAYYQEEFCIRLRHKRRRLLARTKRARFIASARDSQEERRVIGLNELSCST